MTLQKLSMIFRSISTSNIVSQLVRPPVQVYGIEGRYATALYSAAIKQKTIDEVEKDITKLESVIKTDTKLRSFIEDPTIKRSVKAITLKVVGEKISLKPESINLLEILAENGRLQKLEGVISAFKAIMLAHRGEVICEVTTAKELTGEQKEKLLGVLKSFVKPSQTVTLTIKVDPSIIGGLIVSIGDKYVDMSVANSIKRYTDIISKSVS